MAVPNEIIFCSCYDMCGDGNYIKREKKLMIDQKISHKNVPLGPIVLMRDEG